MRPGILGFRVEKRQLVNFLFKYFVVETSLESHPPQPLRY
jgi:hypothetical protein